MKLKEMFKSYGSIPTNKGDVLLTIASGIPTITGKGKSVKITVQPETAKRPISGYLLTDSDAFKIIEIAEQEGHHVMLRFEKQRKKKVDVNIPIAELCKTLDDGRENVFNTCVGVFNYKTKQWVLAGNFADATLDPDVVVADAMFAYNNADESVDVDKFFTEPQQRAPKVYNPNYFDKQQQLFTFYFFIRMCANKYGYTLKEEQIRDMAKRVLQLSDLLQKEIRQSEVVDYKDYSHNRARYLVFSFEEHVKNLNQEEIKNFKGWLKSCYDFSKNLIVWGAEE